jgi:hypothetical protein
MIKKFLHSIIVNFISWYLREKCGYAVHNYPYGKRGRYIVMITENQYHEFRQLVEWPAEKPAPMVDTGLPDFSKYLKTSVPFE